MRKCVFSAHADKEVADQPVHPHSLIRTLAIRLQNQLVVCNIMKERKFLFSMYDFNGLSRSLLFAYVPETHFFMT